MNNINKLYKLHNSNQPYIIYKSNNGFKLYSDFSKKILSSKKPLVIIGESAAEIKSGKYVVEGFKKFLKKNNFINKDWNAFNFLPQNASTVGLIDLNILSKEDEKRNSFFEKLNNNQFKLLYLLGSDNLDIKKNNEFIIYQGSHGDKGAELSDLILPGAAYTEKESHYTNLEGKMQKTYLASYPPGDAKDDWEIINELSELLKRKKLFSNKNEVVDGIENYLKIKYENKQDLEKSETHKIIDEIIKVEEIDYYYSNVIARASKTMSECRSNLIKFKSTGTDG